MTSDNPDEMLSRHTPGPWNYWGYRIVEPGEQQVATVELMRRKSYEEGHQEALANARLIAAAPDLAEALRKIMNAHASNVMFHDRALAERAWTALSRLNP